MNRHQPALPVRSTSASHRTVRERGFTLVELLVVITILAMLVALLIPAVQAARNAARRTTCLNNEKQLTTAVLNYVTSKQKFPPMFTAQPNWSRAGTAQAVGWVPSILPYIEQNEYYRLYQSDQLFRQPRLEAEVLICPSRAPTNSPAPLCYVVNGGATDLVRNNEPMDYIDNGVFFDEFTPTQGLGVKKTPPIDLAYLSSNDGTSKTILLAENNDARDWYRLPVTPTAYQPFPPGNGTNPPGQSWWNAITWMQPDKPPGAPATWGTQGDASTNMILGREAQLGSNPEDKTHGRPYSDHSGGFHVAFADGRVQFMSIDVEYRVYCLLMSPVSATAKYTGAPTSPNNNISIPGDIGKVIIYPAGTAWHDAAGNLKLLTDADLNP